MTAEEFTEAYPAGIQKTIALLMKRRYDLDMSEEIAQHAWAVVWEKRDQWRREASIRTLANNIAFYMIRSHGHFGYIRKHDSLVDHPGLPDQSQTEDILRIECFRWLSVFTRTLKPKDRLILHARLEGYEHGEIAKKLGLAESSIRARMMRMARKLRHRMLVNQTRTVSFLNCSKI